MTKQKNVRVAVNGFGRIGRLFFRQLFGEPGFSIVAVNDLGDLENFAYLLKHDSVYRTWDKAIEVRGSMLEVDGKEIQMIAEKDPMKLPWKDLNIDIVIEATGAFESFEKSRAHIVAGAKRVVISAPAKDDEQADAKTVLMGLNEKDFGKCVITSNGSCTTNATHPIVAVLHEAIGIHKAFLATTHSYTATQNLVDGPTRGKDFRRGRAGAVNIAPSFTGAAISVTRSIPELEGKFDGLAYRVPIAAGSLADITFLAKRKTSVAEVNGALRAASLSDRWRGILGVSDEQLVSSDVVGTTYGALIDLPMTKVVDGDFVKVLSWYDNEWGYVSTLVKHVEKVVEHL